MSKIYKIYHLPHYVWKDGSIGKIGVTHNSLKQRFSKYKNQNLSDSEILEEWDCKYKVSDREIELQKEYRYKVDKIPYWKAINIATKESSSKGGKIAGIINFTKEQRIKYGSIGGNITGRKNVESGHMKLIQNKSAIARRKPILQYDKDGNFIKEWISAAEACRQENFSNSKICKVAKGHQKSHKGYIWKYKDEK